MESFGLYEDLSLFNGDLLLENVSEPFPAEQGEKDGTSNNETVQAPQISPSAQEILAHPQNGSLELSLEDLLATSPKQDLPDPFTTSSAWMDTKTDLVDLLTGFNTQPLAQETPEQVSSPLLFSHPIQEDNVESVGTIQTSLLVDLAQSTSPAESSPQGDLSSNCYVYVPNAIQESSDMNIDILDELNEAGLEQLLGNASNTNTASLFDVPVLSPVSADDVESLLSSSPQSPSEEVQLASLFSSLTDGSTTLNVDDVVSRVGPHRSLREKAREAPYLVGAAATAPANSPRKSRTDRRERKKEQNRTAALRYREKKRSEQEIIQDECNELEVRNKALRDKVDSISREIKYLKDLMADVRKARSKAKKSGGAF